MFRFNTASRLIEQLAAFLRQVFVDKDSRVAFVFRFNPGLVEFAKQSVSSEFCYNVPGLGSWVLRYTEVAKAMGPVNVAQVYVDVYGPGNVQDDVVSALVFMFFLTRDSQTVSATILFCVVNSIFKFPDLCLEVLVFCLDCRVLLTQSLVFLLKLIMFLS